VDIDELFNHHGTDKECYAAMYHALFKHIRHSSLRLLEIGIGTMIPGAASSMVGWGGPAYRPGGSLRAWRDYFPKAEIHGIDIQPDTQFSNEPRIHTHICNSIDADAVRSFMTGFTGYPFDIIIDDGSHLDLHQLATLRNFYPYVSPGGHYIIEDVVPGSTLLTTLYEPMRLIIGKDFLFVTEKRNFVVISRRFDAVA
jgi:hypothetical protein